ncbi:MAG: histidine kinase N-terminal 7TM domain-containing protein [Chloroflexota bacterium]
MGENLLILAMQRLNEALTAATVIVATSMLLYNLTHSLRDGVIRASSVLLGCVSVTYLGDVFVSISGTPHSVEAWLRFQWIGIAFAPAALFHLSDALLATTGLISRGRRRRVVRLLYLYGVIFLLTAVFTNLIVDGLTVAPMPMMQPGSLFWLYLVYFLAVTIFAVNNVLRARRRCLTSATHRRMTFLLLVFLTPSAGIFPYSLLFHNPARTDSLLLWVLINLGNLGIALMLVFMAYPLSFFGSNRPDRVIKAELLRFMLRGPVTGVLVLLVILFVPASRFFGLPGLELMPFAAVATVLLLQWLFTLAIPVLEGWLIYRHDQDQIKQVREFSQRLMTREDAHQLLESTLAAVCDYLRVSSAFVASVGPQGARLEQVIGPLLPSQTWLSSPEFMAIAAGEGTLPEGMQIHGDVMVWQSFWLLSLHGQKTVNQTNGNSPSNGPLLGVMGVWARASQPDLLPEEEAVFKVLYTRAAHVLEGMRLQEELFTTFENVLRETGDVQYGPDPVPYGNAAALVRSASGDVVAEPDFIDLIKNALRHYWGGPRLTERRLLDLNIVKRALAENDNNPAKAVRAVLTQAIESLKPEGQRSMTTTEWILYNILEMRFIQGHKVRDVTLRLSMSEADLYRKQNMAIEQVAQRVAEMEKHHNDGDMPADMPSHLKPRL